MIADSIGIPACFSSGERSTDDPGAPSVTRAGQNVIMSIYKTKLRDQTRLITVTWCRNVLLLHGLSVSISTPSNGEPESPEYTCKIEMKPWYFWRKHGSKRLTFDNDGKTMDVFWDLRSAKFINGETQPSSDYYVAVVFDNEVVLFVGDLRSDVLKKTGCRPAFIEPTLVSKKEHIFGKRRFVTKAKFHDKGRFHDIIISCKNKVDNNNSSNSNNVSGKQGLVNSGPDPEMEVRVDGQIVIHIKHLQWKFRGNECIHVNKLRVEVYWDVHDWLFTPGLRNALFIFKPIIPPSMLVSPVSLSSSLSLPLSLSSTPLSSQTGSSGSTTSGSSENLEFEFCLFLYAWKIDY